MNAGAGAGGRTRRGDAPADGRSSLSAAPTRGVPVLIVGPTLKFGGKANFTKTIVSGLRDSGFDIELLEASRSARPKRGTGRSAGWRFRNRMLRIPEVAVSSALQKWRFATLLAGGRFGAAQIHVSSYFDFYDLSLLVWIARALRRRVIVRCGGGEFDGFYLGSSRVGKWYVARVLRSADRVIAQSGYWQEFIASMGVSRERIHVIPNFVDVEYWTAPLGEGSPAPDGVTLVYMPGGSEHRKGYHTFMPAFARLAARRPELRLRLIGLGRELDEVYRPLAQRGQIEVLDFVSGEQKRQAIASGHVFVLPTHSEGFPNALIEGMAAGLAVISSRIPQITAIVDEGVNGLLVDPADSDEIEAAIETLCRQPELRRQMGSNNIARCRERYDTSLIPHHFRRLYGIEERGGGEPEATRWMASAGMDNGS